MNSNLKIKISPTLHAPIEKIRLIKPNIVADANECECYVNIGFFFDGTNNNYDADIGKVSHSNIARLSDAYRNNPGKGYFKIYVPGVGSKFPKIAEFKESNLGSGFGIGCEARVIFAMLTLFNSFHQAAFDEIPYFTDAQVRALCSVRNSLKTHVYNLIALSQLGLGSGLLNPNFFGNGNRDDFFLDQSKKLSQKLEANQKPKIKECFIDVFGFSRGAAEARVFCGWLNKLMIDGKFAGVPLRFRFVGIMDTVASAGFWSGIGAGIRNTPDGHSGWAAAEYLRLPKVLENCIHMVAMHELRRNFPLDSVSVDEMLPPNTQEIVYPGAHSDVGGGYGLGELGVSVSTSLLEADSLRLSQIPLNHMLECAVAAGVPMEKNRAAKMIVYNPLKKTMESIPLRFDPFAVSQKVSIAYASFISALTLSPRSISDWMQPYLNWRWQNRYSYDDLLHVIRASEADKKILRKFNDILIRDASFIDRMNGTDKAEKFHTDMGMNPFNEAELVSALYFDKEAKIVLNLARNSPIVPMPLHHFFDNFVHDSLAGFNSVALEPTGYWRYRKGFLGGSVAKIVMSKQKNDSSHLA